MPSQHVATEALAYSDPIGLNRIIRRAIEKVFKRKLKAGDVDTKLAKSNAEKIWEGVQKGFKKEAASYNYGSPEQRLLLNLRYNVHVTAAFKNHHNTLEMVRALFDENGKPRDFAGFKKEAQKINKAYNKTWLSTEYDLATKSASWAEQWTEFEQRGGKLEYRSQRDGRVRDSHRVLDGTVLPVDDKFWDTYYPPNGWRCRCFVRRRPDTYDDVPPTGVPDDMPDMFKTNVGKTGKVFTKDTPYFEVEGQFSEKADRLFGYLPPVDPERFKKNLTLYDDLIEDKDHELEYVNNLNGSFVFRHIRANKDELKELMPVSKTLADHETNGIIINEVKKTGRNPDLTINGAVVELKTVRSTKYNRVDGAIREAKDQAGIIVLDIKSDISKSVLEKAIYDRVKRSPNITGLTVIYKGNVYPMTRDEIVSGSFYGKIQ